MNITEISKLLNGINSSQSNFEFENFFLENIPTPARQLVAALTEMEKLHAERLDLETRRAAPDNTDGENILLDRALSDNQHKYDRLSKWLDAIPVKERKSIIANFETEEPIYWANVLGRRAALELLALGRTTNATMDQMTMLPVDEFEESVRICVKYSNLIKDTTDMVESKMNLKTSGVPKRSVA